MELEREEAAAGRLPSWKSIKSLATTGRGRLGVPLNIRGCNRYTTCAGSQRPADVIALAGSR